MENERQRIKSITLDVSREMFQFHHGTKMAYSITEFGFEDFELEDEEEPDIIEDEPPEPTDGEPKAKRGDVYKLGRHRLMCGDSTIFDDVIKLTGGVSHL